MKETPPGMQPAEKQQFTAEEVKKKEAEEWPREARKYKILKKQEL